MTDTINVPRDLLERIVGKCKLSVLGDDRARVWELLAAPAVECEELDDHIREVDDRLLKAQAIIDKQAAMRVRANELKCCDTSSTTK